MSDYQPAPPNAPYGGGGYNTARTNTLSIVGLILAIVIPIVGLILSYVARSQIRRTGEQGAGLALAGIIIGWVLTVLGVIILIIYIIVIVAIVGSHPELSQ